MRQLTVNLLERSYNIYIDDGLLDSNSKLLNYCSGDNVLILSNEVIAPIFIEKIKRSLVGKTVSVFLIPDGEVQKNLANFGHILDFLIKNEFRRNDTLISLGGGVIGDLGGYVAASFQRGMNFIQVPTSLLAQVDSSVGGKTAVNHPFGKNLIGAFYQPKAVFIDLQCLESLPEREYISGFAEIAKYAILGELNILEILLNQTAMITSRNKKVLADLIYYSCEKKAQVVAQDEQERGNRALLNLGHTFGHAIERVTDYKEYLHGEAVSIGIHMAISMASEKNLISSSRADIYRGLLTSLGLPNTPFSKLKLDEVFGAMKLDKKNVNKTYRLVLPGDGGCFIVEESDFSLIKRVIGKHLC